MAYRRLPRRVAGLFRNRVEIEGDVDDEIAFHLEMRTAALMRQGLDEATARERAEREFGDAQQLRRELRRSDGGRERRLKLVTWLDELRQDVRFAWRSLRRAPVFTLVALATLAVGIGAAVAMFAVVNAVVLRPLPYDAPERLVHVWPGHNVNITLAAEVGSAAPSLESWTGIAIFGLTLTGRGDAQLLRAQAVDAGFFDVFRIRPGAGRRILPDERDPARSDVVLISHELWQTQFGGDAGVIGQRVDLDGYGHRTREVIGVMPRGFVPPMADAAGRIDVWIPLHVPAGRTVATDSTWYVNNVVGRLRAGATPEGLSAEVGVVLARLRAETGGIISEEAVQAAGAAGLLDSMVGPLRSHLWLLLGAVGLVLLLACANLANLLLARGERRRGELAARAALGGTRSRLVRELVTESAVLAVAGTAAGVLLARLILSALRVAESSGLPRAAQLGIDGRVLAFATMSAVGCLMLFALLPALRVTAGDLRPDLAGARRTAGPTRSGRRLGSVLIATEVALAMVLVTGAALLIQSFRVVRSVDAGLDAASVLSVQIAPPPDQYQGDHARIFYARLLEQLRGLPGVRSAGAIHLLPFTWSNWGFPYLAEGHAPPANAPLPAANFRVVTPGYFETMRIPVLSGRTFAETDGAEPAIGLINRTLAEQLWPGEDAVGREIRLFGSVPFRVIGVVADVRQHSLEAEPQPEMYRPFTQWPLATMVLMLDTESDPAAWIPVVRRVLAELDPNVPVVEARPLGEVVAESLARRRFFARTLTFFGALALALGAIGVYGVMTYSVSARVPEFSVRMALGATHREILREALRSALIPVAAGMLVGTLAALAATRLLESLLFGVQPRDPFVLALAAVVLGASAVLAGWLPARRVRRVQPMSVLNAG